MAEEQVDTVTEAFGSDEASKAKRWINEITLSVRSQDTWLGRCRKIIRRYKDERGASSALLANDRRRFATLWSNIEVLKPAVYAKKPLPLVTQRWKGQTDPLARTAAEVLQRALQYTIDAYDFDWVMKQVRDDNLICGIGVTWARYVPVIETEEASQVSDDATEQARIKDESPEAEYVATERVVCDHVKYSDFGTNKARAWDEVRFVWRRVFMDRAALKKRFATEVPGTGKTIGEVLPLDWKPETDQQDIQGASTDELFAKAQIFEIWDLDTRKVYWISLSYPMRVLDEVDDPLRLKDFFPCPRPVFATLGPDSTIPVPDYIFYQDQAEEIDDLTLRIGILTDSLRMVGFYAGQQEVNMQNVFKSGNENKLIPVDSWAAFKESGGVKGMIEWVPIDMVVACLTACYESRKQLLDDVYQITGISDIMRGDTDPRETKGAQVLKASSGSRRVKERAKELERFARDNLDIKAQIIAGNFSWQTLKEMTNVELLTNEEKALIQQQMALQQQQTSLPNSSASPSNGPSAAPMQGGPSMAGQTSPAAPSIPPEIEQKLKLPTWEEIEAFLRNSALRLFRTDVETDSTIEPDAAQEKADMNEFIGTVGAMITNSVAVIQAAPPMAKLIGQMVKVASRKFAFGRELEETIDEVMDAVSQQAPVDPNASPGEDPQIAQMEAQIEQGKLQIEQGKLALKQQEIAMKEREAATKAMLEKYGIDVDVMLQREKMAVEDRRTQMEIENSRREALTDRVFNAHQSEQDRAFQGEQSDRDRQFAFADAERGRENDRGENERERQNRIDVTKARPKPGGGK